MAGGRRLFVISDLHLGGRSEARICNAHSELVDFVDWVRTQDCSDDRELVVNGDIIDFLAEDDVDEEITSDAWTRDDKNAVKKLERIVEGVRQNGRGFFDALRDLLAAGHRVTLMLGNHDVELSLPRVRARLEDLLGHGRLRFVYDGEAYTAGKVLIEHGNRYDSWNALDFDRLREERSVRSRQLPIADDDRRGDRYFKAPAGSLLVANFMNPLKRKYRFIDLLKPETGAVLPLLLALEPDLDLGLRTLLKAAPIVRQVMKSPRDTNGMPLHEGQLGGAAAAGGQLSLDDILRRELGNDAKLFTVEQAHGTQLGGVRDLFSKLASYARKLRDAATSLNQLIEIKSAPSEDLRRRRLRAALTVAAASDRSFKTGYELDDYRTPAETLCREGGFDVVVFGHTHLPKQIKLDQAVGRPATYLNTGTWADVIRIDELAAPVEESFIDALAKNHLRDYTRRYLTYAEITVAGDDVRSAAIHSFCGKADPRGAPLTPAP